MDNVDYNLFILYEIGIFYGMKIIELIMWGGGVDLYKIILWIKEIY